MSYFLPCLYAFIACVGFDFLYNIRGRRLVTTSLGGALGWFVYLSCYWFDNDIPRYFLATVAISIYAEIMARVDKVPVIVYLITAILPLVPGGGMYYTMEYWLMGDASAFAEKGSQTMMIAGAIALAVVLVSSLVRMWKTMRRLRYLKHIGKQLH